MRIKKNAADAATVFHPAVGLAYHKADETAATAAAGGGRGASISLCTDAQYFQQRLEACGIASPRDGASAGGGMLTGAGAGAGMSSAASVASGASGGSSGSSGGGVPVSLDLLPPAPAPKASSFKSYAADGIFGGEASQAAVYAAVAGPLLRRIEEGVNTAILAYG